MTQTNNDLVADCSGSHRLAQSVRSITVDWNYKFLTKKLTPPMETKTKKWMYNFIIDSRSFWYRNNFGWNCWNIPNNSGRLYFISAHVSVPEKWREKRGCKLSNATQRRPTEWQSLAPGQHTHITHNWFVSVAFFFPRGNQRNKRNTQRQDKKGERWERWTRPPTRPA